MGITRITDTGDGQWVRPRGQTPVNAGPTTGPFVSTDTVQAGPAAAGRVVAETADLHETIWPVTDVGTGESLVTGIPRILSVWWMGDDVSADNAALFVSDVATGTIDVVCENAAIEGYILIKHRG